MMIYSILDTDFYKISMQQAVLALFPNTQVAYKFKNRGKHRFNDKFLQILKQQICEMSQLKLTNEEYNWLKTVSCLQPHYLEYLKNYRYNTDEVTCHLDNDNNLVLDINGYWRDTILWEVPLMALISECYFKVIDKQWDYYDVKNNTDKKGNKLKIFNCDFSEFGTRRRRSYKTQDIVCNTLKKYNNCIGTSNLHFAMKYGLKPIGTVAHEFIQGNSVLESLNHANLYALKNWNKVYHGDLDIALTDTFTTDMFLKDFDATLSKMYCGIRHDSGHYIQFIDKIVKHYQKFNIDPLSKTIVFSDSLNIDKCIEIKKYCENKIKCFFGIGTHFTNDFENNNTFQNSDALNMVIKLWSVNGFPVVKLSDVSGKENGDTEAIKNMKYIVKKTIGN